MNFVLAVFVVVGFAVTIERLHLPARAREVGQHSTASLDALQDESLSDADKEAALQDRSGQLFRLLGILTGGSALTLCLPLGIVWLLGQVGVGSFQDTLAVLQRIDFLAGTTVAGLLGYMLAQRVRAP